MKIQKKKIGGVGGGGGGAWGVRVDVNEGIEVFAKIQKKNFLGGGGSGWRGQDGCEN